jgi:hypothetical protein
MSQQDFINELKALGHDVQVPGNGRVMFTYQIPLGRFVGQTVTLGFEVPGDYPLTCPGGPHMKPRLLPLNSGGEHPNGRIHESNQFGPEWEYWSRPFHEWSKTGKNAREYMAHVRHLFDQ